MNEKKLVKGLRDQVNSLQPEAFKAHNPCQGTEGIPAGFKVCGAESCRLAPDGKRYCEIHWNRLPSHLKDFSLHKNKEINC